MRRMANWSGRLGLLATLAVGAALGFGLAFWLQSGALETGRARVQDLPGAGAAGDSARERLEARVRQLEEDLNNLLDLTAIEEFADLASSDTVAPAPDPAPRRTPTRKGPAQGPSFDERALAAAGLDPDATGRIKAHWERLLLSRLGLANRALREGWARSKRYTRESRELEWELREAFGERDYEFLLYATGRPTRLIARDVLVGAAASADGIEVGDTILRYDGERMFQPRDLRWATLTGDPGTSVWIEVLRDGEVRRFSVRRGPLGIILATASLPPLED